MLGLVSYLLGQLVRYLLTYYHLLIFFVYFLFSFESLFAYLLSPWFFRPFLCQAEDLALREDLLVRPAPDLCDAEGGKRSVAWEVGLLGKVAMVKV